MTLTYTEYKGNFLHAADRKLQSLHQCHCNKQLLLFASALEADFLRFSFVVNSQASDSKILFLSW